jgi:ABC-2 type transport system permease protein
MTAMTAPAPSAGVPASAKTPFSRLLRVEFRKSYDTRSGFWLLFTIAALVLVAELIASIVRGVHDHNNPFDQMQWEDFATVAGVVTEILLPVIGILLVTAEWSQRTGMTTFTLEPRRSTVIWAKMLVGILFSAATVVFVLLTGAVFNALYGVLSGHADWTFPIKGIIGFFIAQCLAMLTGFAFACLCLSSPASIVAYVAMRFVLPALFGIGEALMSWFNSVGPWLDFQSAQTPLYDWSFSGSDWGKLVVSGAIWLLLPLGLGIRRILGAELK